MSKRGQSHQRRADQKEARQRVERAFYKRCSGIQIDIMKISEIMNHGIKAVEAGVTDEQLENEIERLTKTLATV